MRPTIQPLMVIVLYKLLSGISLFNPFALSTILRLCSAALSLLVINGFYKLYKKEFDGSRQLLQWFTLLTFFLWFQLYNGVRFSSENWSANLFALAFLAYFKKDKEKSSHHIYIGLLMGLAFVFRFQTAFLSAGFIAWMLIVKREAFKNILLQGAGILLSIAMGVLIDSWFYEEFTFSAWAYFEQNVMLDKVSNFDIHPWWYYFSKTFIQGIPPLSIWVILACLIFIIKQWRHPISWIIVPFLLVHFKIGHKETRFLFPIILFLPFIIVFVIKLLNERWGGKLITNKYFYGSMVLSLAVNFIFLLITCFRPADPQIGLYEKVYETKEPAVFYHFGKNPYHRILGVEFYKRETLTVQEVASLEAIPQLQDSVQLVVFDNKAELSEEFMRNNELIYSTFPKWILQFNVNNWQKRTNSWRVYRLGTK